MFHYFNLTERDGYLNADIVRYAGQPFSFLDKLKRPVTLPRLIYAGGFEKLDTLFQETEKHVWAHLEMLKQGLLFRIRFEREMHALVLSLNQLQTVYLEPHDATAPTPKRPIFGEGLHILIYGDDTSGFGKITFLDTDDHILQFRFQRNKRKRIEKFVTHWFNDNLV